MMAWALLIEAGIMVFLVPKPRFVVIPILIKSWHLIGMDDSQGHVHEAS